MSDVSNDPGYVFKRFGLLCMVLAMLMGIGVVGAIAFGGLKVQERLTFFLLAGMTGMPFAAGLALVSDWFRNLLIDLAHSLPFVKFQKPDPPNG